MDALASGLRVAAEAAEALTEILAATRDQTIAEEVTRDPSCIVAIMRRGFKELRQGGALLHAIFTMLPDFREAVVAAGAIPVLIAGLASDDEAVVTQVVLILPHFFFKGPSAATLALEAGALKPLLALLATGPLRAEEIRVHAAKSLNFLLPDASKEQRDRALADGAPRHLASLLSGCAAVTMHLVGCLMVCPGAGICLLLPVSCFAPP